MRPLTEWLELMLAEISQRQEQARAGAEEAERRGSGAQAPRANPQDLPDSEDARNTSARQAPTARTSEAPRRAHRKGGRASIA